MIKLSKNVITVPYNESFILFNTLNGAMVENEKNK